MHIYIPTWLAWYLLGVLTPIAIVFTAFVLVKKEDKDEDSPHK